MIDFGFDKLALIGAVALIVIGPEKLPKMARTVGHLVGKAQRYVAEVKSEVNRSIELDELKKMKTEFEDAARNVEQTVSSEINSASSSFDQSWKEANDAYEGRDDGTGKGYDPVAALASPTPAYKNPKKNWRLKRGTTPTWYKKQHGVRTQAQSGAARVARHRPKTVAR
jgi:sec-independent protein translocase protein TatB